MSERSFFITHPLLDSFSRTVFVEAVPLFEAAPVLAAVPVLAAAEFHASAPASG